jgi:histidine triad (HIT) family protein
MPTIFTRIIQGEIPGTFVWRDDYCVAFLSINPLAGGHVLVVPYDEVEHWIDLPLHLNRHLMEVSQLIGQAQRAAFPQSQRIGLIIAGYEVPHVHVHVIPTEHMGQFNFATAAAHVEREDLEAAAEAIRAELRSMGRAEVVSAPH